MNGLLYHVSVTVFATFPGGGSPPGSAWPRTQLIGSPAPSDDSDPYEPREPPEISSQQSTQVSRLKLCPYADWDPERVYDEDPPIYIYITRSSGRSPLIAGP
jgi:hypothetical protein